MASSQDNLSQEQEDLSKGLTRLQRMFAINLADPDISQRKALRKAGSKIKTDRSLDAAASRMLADVKVRAFYDSLVKQAETSAVLTRERALESLSENAEQAEEHRDQHQAIKQLSTMQGWEAPKKSEITGKDGGPIQVQDMSDAELKEIIKRGKR